MKGARSSSCSPVPTKRTGIFNWCPIERTIPPLELPSETGLTYFRLLRGESTRMWDRIKEEKAVALRWPTIKDSDLKAALYMTVANVEDKA